MSADEKVMTPEDSKQEVTEAKFDGAVSDQSTLGAVQDLGGPTPMNSKPDDESNKLKTGGGPTATAQKTNLLMLVLRSTSLLKQKMQKATTLLRLTYPLM